MEDRELPNDLKALLKDTDISEADMKNILKESNIKFYWNKNDIIKEFCEWLVCSSIEEKYSYLKYHYLSVKDEHWKNHDNNSMTFKYIYNKISPKLDLEINNNQINMWIKDIKKFWKEEIKMFSYMITPPSDDFWKITNKFFFDNYINKDWIPSISAWFNLAYRDMFQEINNELIKFLENKIK